jgi:hypothetical protein
MRRSPLGLLKPVMGRMHRITLHMRRTTLRTLHTTRADSRRTSCGLWQNREADQMRAISSPLKNCQIFGARSAVGKSGIRTYRQSPIDENLMNLMQRV